MFICVGGKLKRFSVCKSKHIQSFDWKNISHSYIYVVQLNRIRILTCRQIHSTTNVFHLLEYENRVKLVCLFEHTTTTTICVNAACKHTYGLYGDGRMYLPKESIIKRIICAVSTVLFVRTWCVCLSLSVHFSNTHSNNRFTESDWMGGFWGWWLDYVAQTICTILGISFVPVLNSLGAGIFRCVSCVSNTVYMHRLAPFPSWLAITSHACSTIHAQHDCDSPVWV